MATFIQKKSPDGKTENEIDFVIMKENASHMITNTRSYKAACIDSDHYLLVSEMKLKIKKERVTRERPIDTRELQNIEKQLEFEIELNNRFEQLPTCLEDPETEFTNLKNNITEVGKKLLKPAVKKNKGATWLSERTKEITDQLRIMKINNEAARANQNLTTDVSTISRELKQLRSKLRHSIKEDNELY